MWWCGVCHRGPPGDVDGVGRNLLVGQIQTGVFPTWHDCKRKKLPQRHPTVRYQGCIRIVWRQTIHMDAGFSVFLAPRRVHKATCAHTVQYACASV
jgi:hypothetical protein